MEYRAYFKLKFTLLSPLSIGDSISVHSDKDVILDSRGLPVIPATSIAGKIRSFSSEADRDKYFGVVKINTNPDNDKIIKQEDSAIAFYDAEYDSKIDEKKGKWEKAIISIRDSVALDEYKTAKKGAKFDFQIVEPGAVFFGFVEAFTKEAADKFQELLPKEIYLGSKTTRGYGKIRIGYQFKEFRLIDTGLDDWLGFNMFCDNEWEEWEEKVEGSIDRQDSTKEKITINISLKQNNSGLSIRQYYIKPVDTKPDSADYGPLTLKNNTPVIPGASWAGLFRHHMNDLLKDENLTNEFFGFVDPDKKKSSKSKITFGESILKGYTKKQLTRNAIDRFTNGTKDKALYTENTIYGGCTNLEIMIDKGIKDEVIFALCATIMDIHYGYAALGGLTAVGRGLFSITGIQINGKKLDSFGFDSLVQEVCND